MHIFEQEESLLWRAVKHVSWGVYALAHSHIVGLHLATLHQRFMYDLVQWFGD